MRPEELLCSILRSPLVYVILSQLHAYPGLIKMYRDYCKEKGVELEMTAIGADALVFIASLENEVASLSQEQIEEIYSGNITNWSEVGGDDHAIIPYQRNKDSGSQTLFDKLIPLGDKLMDAPEETKIGSMIGLLEAVADYDNSADALGYTVYYYLSNMEGEKLTRSTPSCSFLGSFRAA